MSHSTQKMIRSLFVFLFTVIFGFSTSAQIDLGLYTGIGLKSSYGGHAYGISSLFAKKVGIELGFNGVYDAPGINSNLYYLHPTNSFLSPSIGIGYNTIGKRTLEFDETTFTAAENAYWNVNLGISWHFDPAVISSQSFFVNNMYYHLKIDLSYRLANNTNSVSQLSGPTNDTEVDRLNKQFGNGLGFSVSLCARFRVYKMFKKPS